MTQNDFYVAIQGILLDAHGDKWSINQIVDHAEDAILEFEKEMIREEMRKDSSE